MGAGRWGRRLGRQGRIFRVVTRLSLVIIFLVSCAGGQDWGERCHPVAYNCGGGWQRLTNCGSHLTTSIGHSRRHYRFYDHSAGEWRAGNLDATCKVEYL